MTDIEVFSDSRDLLGESPRWHPHEKRLYWVDINSGILHCQAPGDKEPVSHSAGLKIGCFAFEKTGSLILATSSGIQRWNADRAFLMPLSDPEPGKPGARFNDGLVDGAGRFWAGTMTEHDASSSLYCLNPDLGIRTMVSGVTISNGIGWNKQNTRLYFTDTLKRTIWLYDFDLVTGSLSNRRVYLETRGPGLPDGLAIDTQGNVWCVLCGAGLIAVHDPAGKLLEEIRFPTRCITACTFGGENLADLYVTSSRSLLKPAEEPGDPLAGNVFRLATRSQGLPDHYFG
jgi:sugar lactone lactonase YvrE